MSWLPPLVVGETTWRLPLADGAAILLAELLTVGGSDSLVDRFKGAVAVDPALAAWCLLQAEPPLASCIDSIASWLVGHGGQIMTGQSCPTDFPQDAAAGKILQLARQAVRVAEVAAMLADQQQSNRETAYLAGLLADIAPWLVSTPSEEPSATPLLVGVLRERLGDNSALDCAAQARRMILNGKKPPAGLRLPKRQLKRRGKAARRHWQKAAPGAAAWFSHLAAELGRLRGLEANFGQRLEQEKLESLAEFAAGAGHEMNNPLAVISGRVQLFLRDERNPERRRELALINGQALRVHEMISDLMLFARPPQPRLERVDIAVLLATLAAELRERAAERRVTLRIETADEPLWVNADPTQLLVALKAVCDNALNAIGEEGEVAVAARREKGESALAKDSLAHSATTLPQSNGQQTPANEPNAVSISIQDTGPGIPPEIRRHAFDPYFSGRAAGRGLGVGLSKCWRIVTLHGGRVEIVDSKGGRGATFVITLPAIPPSPLYSGERGRG